MHGRGKVILRKKAKVVAMPDKQEQVAREQLVRLQRRCRGHKAR